MRGGSNRTERAERIASRAGRNAAIVIGVNKYRAPLEDLTQSVAGALQMREWLQHPEGGDVPSKNLTLLLAADKKMQPKMRHKRATYDNILNAFEGLLDKQGEQLFVYFSGHGVSDTTKRADEAEYWMPADGTPNKPNLAMHFAGILDLCARLKFKKQFFFADACRSPSWTSSTRVLQFGPLSRTLRAPLSDVHQFVLFSTRPNEPAYEEREFTRALVSGLTTDGGARKWDSVQRKYVVTFSSLHDHIARMTPLIFQAPRRAGQFGSPDPVLASFAPPLPRPDGTRFSVAVSHLDKDPAYELETLLVDQLCNIGDLVQVLNLDRPVLEDGLQAEERYRAAQKTVSEYLKETDIDGIIWGERLTLANAIAARLIFATSEKTVRPTRLYPVRELSLPPAFWDDVAAFLCLIVLSGGTAFQNEQMLLGLLPRAPSVRHQLEVYIRKASKLLGDAKGQVNWSADTGATVKMIVGTALLTAAQYAQMFGDSIEVREDQLGRAATLLEEAADEWADEFSFERRSCLGNLALVERERGNLEEAIGLLRRLVVLYEEANDPPDIRAINYLNLGNALCEAAERPGNDYARALQFDEAAGIFMNVVAMAPAGSALSAAAHTGRAQAFLGAATRSNSEVTRRRLLKEAEADAGAVVSILGCEQSPLSANARHVHATVLRRLGESDPGTERIVKAVEILREIDGEGFPTGLRARYAASLANALAILGKRTGKPEPLLEALKIRTAIMPDMIAVGDLAGIEQGICDANEDLRLLGATGADIKAWMEENGETWAEITQDAVDVVRRLREGKNGP